jgi:HEAT repeat protein
VLAILVTTVLLLGGARAADQGAGRPQAEAAPTLDSLSAQLREAKPDRRRSAVRGLAKLATPAAWRLVLDALADPESAVGDEAQLVLGGIADPKLIAELAGRSGLDSREERVVLRAAEALGRVGASVDGEALAKRISTRDEAASALLVWSIERLAAARKLAGRPERIAERLVIVSEAKSQLELSCAALIALAAVDEAQGKERACDALKDRAPERRCAALVALANLRCPEAFGAGVSLSSDPDPRVRMAAAECLDSVGTRVAMLALIARLGEETRLRVRWRIVDLLQRASGLKHRLDPRPWKLWAEALPENGVLRRMEPARKGTREDPQATKSGGFAGLPIVSDRVAFLFDFSGSMWTALDDGRLPKDIVADKLRAALETLPESTEFNLIPFTNEPIPWAEELRPAKKAEVQRALAFFDGCQQRGRGNFYDAALLAMADPKVDTLVVLTDGVPTGGFHSDMDLIVPLLAERTRYRKLVVDSILVDAPYGTQRRWEDLARRTGGRCIEVELGSMK